MILDLDATLVTAHSDKEQAAGNYKHGFGFHPLLCYEATTEEALAGILRPGNAGADTAADHVELLDLALAQLPESAKGPGLLVRADSGGATHAFLDHVASLGCRFSVGFDLTEPVREAVLAVPEQAWRPALTQAGEQRAGAAVAELALDLARWPAGTRAICRRERPHPGAQLSFSDDNGYRFQVFITNQQGRRLERLEQLHRHHAVVEDRIRCGKDTGLANLPFRAFQANAAWLELALIAQDLLAWTQRLLLSGEPPAANRNGSATGSSTSPADSPATPAGCASTYPAAGPGAANSSQRSTPARAPAGAVSRRRSLPPPSNDDRPASACPRNAHPTRPPVHPAKRSMLAPTAHHSAAQQRPGTALTRDCSDTKRLHIQAPSPQKPTNCGILKIPNTPAPPS